MIRFLLLFFITYPMAHCTRVYDGKINYTWKASDGSTCAEMHPRGEGPRIGAKWYVIVPGMHQIDTFATQAQAETWVEYSYCKSGSTIWKAGKK